MISLPYFIRMNSKQECSLTCLIFLHSQLLATGSMDKKVRISTMHHLNYLLTIKLSAKIFDMFQVKLWDLSNNQPSCVASTNPKAVSPPTSISLARWFITLSLLKSEIKAKFLLVLQFVSCFAIIYMNSLGSFGSWKRLHHYINQSNV